MKRCQVGPKAPFKLVSYLSAGQKGREESRNKGSSRTVARSAKAAVSLPGILSFPLAVLKDRNRDKGYGGRLNSNGTGLASSRRRCLPVGKSSGNSCQALLSTLLFSKHRNDIVCTIIYLSSLTISLRLQILSVLSFSLSSILTLVRFSVVD